MQTNIPRALVLWAFGSTLLVAGCHHDHHPDDHGDVVVYDDNHLEHHGYYDERHDWHGGYYDEQHSFHEDPHDFDPHRH